LSGDEVSYKLFPWVRGLESEKCRFVENTSLSSENAKAEQRSSQLNPLLTLSKGGVSSEPSHGLEVSRVGRMGSRERLPPPLSENTKGKK